MALVASHYLYVSNENTSLAALLSVEEEILVRDYDTLVTYYTNHSMAKCLGFIQAIVKQNISTVISINLMDLDQRFKFNLDRFARYGSVYINTLAKSVIPEFVMYHVVSEHLDISKVMGVPHYLKKENFIPYPTSYRLL